MEAEALPNQDVVLTYYTSSLALIQEIYRRTYTTTVLKKAKKTLKICENRLKDGMESR